MTDARQVQESTSRVSPAEGGSTRESLRKRFECLLHGHEKWSDLQGHWFCMRCLKSSGLLNSRPSIGRCDDGTAQLAEVFETLSREIAEARQREAANEALRTAGADPDAHDDRARSRDLPVGDCWSEPGG